MVRKKGKKPIKTAWIFCEGEKTESYYFSKLRAEERLERLRIKVHSSENKDPVGLVNYSVEFKKHRKDYLSGDLIFCVFDRDLNSNAALANAKNIAEENGLFLIFSNPCFEYWILSHFEYYPQAIEKDLLKRKLDLSLGEYRKNDSELYTKIRGRLDDAVSNSKKVREKHLEYGVEILSRESNPLTLVFDLIEKVNDFK
ncbi:RloB family protein [Methanosarcina sp. Mfa9]|uniref:RloB family protein n=1 Tax=Methanosarcina sp. Mfa9 TaxID=3439063 RepID=UPI003F82F5E2